MDALWVRGTTAHVSRCSLVVNVSKKIMRTIFLLWMLLIVNGANFGITTAQDVSSTSPSTTVVRCGHPAVPVNARLSLSSSADLIIPGTVATYSCDEGYELFGSETTICSTSGIWSGELPFCGMNVALRRPANQSSTVRGGPAVNANDGEKTTVHDGKRCTETMKEPSPWWQVDLLRPYPIKAVRVTTRGCCGHQPIQDLEVRVGNSSSELQRNPLCAWYPDTIEEGVTKTLMCVRTVIGQHVFLQLIGNEGGSLSLCEVEVFTTDEFSNDRCAPKGVSSEAEISSFNRVCYEFNVGKGGSFEEARSKCRINGGDLIHGFKAATTTFLLGELERRKDRLKTQLVWIGAQKDPGITSRTWKWVDGELVSRPSWGKDQPNNYNGEQNCVVLDGGRNWLWNDVGCNLDYLHWICQHQPKSCGSPDKLVNTTIVENGRDVGAIIRYRCPEGHMIIGDENRTCSQEGFWTAHAPSCLYVECGKLNDIENGQVVMVDDRTTYGATARYNCKSNYTLIGSTNTRKCSEGGVWSGAPPQCLFDWCPDPPNISGGVVSVSGKRTGSKATYTCQAGYIIFGQQELTCSIGGEWSGKPPVCKYIDCGAPPNIDNGQYVLINDTTIYGSIVEYKCNEDYWMDQSSRRRQTCTREGKWSFDPPSCELIICNEPDIPPGGYVVGYDFNVHSKIEFHCETGHLLRGQSILECTSQGEWTGNPPACDYIDCGKVAQLQNGSINYINGSTHLDSEVTYSCSKNYKLVGPSVRKCLETQKWSAVQPKCEEIRCPEPVLPGHSVISVTGNDRVYGRTLIRTSNDAMSTTTYKIGALVKFRCERGYKIIGDPLSTCEDNGHWGGEIPQCIFVDCGVPDKIEHGHFMLVSNVTYYGAAVLYECEANYELEGYARRLCLENGTWSSETPSCKEILCKEPELIDDMSVEVLSHTVGGIAEYSCPKGQRIEGNVTRECTSKGVWTGKVPTCKMIECKPPAPIENGRVIIMNQTTTYNSAVEYHCVPQYQRIGLYLRKCTEHGDWSGEEPKCELITETFNEAQTVNFAMSVGVGVILFLLILLGAIYFKLTKAKPVKNTENVQAAIHKEEEGTAAMSYASLSDGAGSNIYEHIPGCEENMYDTPYEGVGHHRHNNNNNGYNHHHYDEPPDEKF